MKRTALFVTIVASLLSIHITLSVIPMIAYGGDENTINNVNKTSITDKYTSAIKTKSSVDEVGLQDTKLSYSKSDMDTKDVLKKQEAALVVAKAEDERIAKQAAEDKAREIALKAEEEAKAKAEAEKARQEAIARESAKMVINSASEARSIEIRTHSNWEASDFDKVVPTKMKALIPVAIRMEKELGINALYLMSVGINETGWGEHMSGHNNYYNWSSDGYRSFDFGSVDAFSDFSIKGYAKFLDAGFYTETLGKRPSKITVEVVNTRYAINHDGSVNWEWTNTVSSVMKRLSDARIGSK